MGRVLDFGFTPKERAGRLKTMQDEIKKRFCCSCGESGYTKPWMDHAGGLPIPWTGIVLCLRCADRLARELEMSDE